jgi:hypothetical protein
MMSVQIRIVFSSTGTGTLPPAGYCQKWQMNAICHAMRMVLPFVSNPGRKNWKNGEGYGLS